MTLDIKTIEALIASGIELTGCISVAWGGQSVVLKAQDVSTYLEDKDQFAANYFGVTKIQYLAWIAQEGAARCSAKTGKGQRCRNLVSGHIQLPIKEWIRREEGYCRVHGGENSEEGRARGFGDEADPSWSY